jgi:hypothetical protein
MTETKSNGRDTRSGRFTAGNHVARGRQGSRNKLSEKFLNDLHKEWRRSGAKALQRTAQDDPVAFSKLVAHLLPRQLDQTMSMNVSLFAEIEDFNEKYRFALAHIGAEIEHKPEPKLIEHGNGHDDSNDD